MIESVPRIITGIFTFTGAGYASPVALGGLAPYSVPTDKRTQLIYLRAGNSADAMVTLVLLRDGTPMRYFPVGAKASTHVPLRVVEDLLGDTVLEVHLAAPEGTTGSVVVDLGMVEV